MARLIFLDAGPLGQACGSPQRPTSRQVNQWIQRMLQAGALIAVPEIADYEVRRELTRIHATTSLRRLDQLGEDLWYVALTTPAMRKAADCWAAVRNTGHPTADPRELDGDCVLAGQILAATGAGDVATVATSNIGHLMALGLDARPWQAIT